MSIESAKACIERMKTDEDFAKQVGGCKDADTRMAIVRAAGYEFTPEEIRKVSEELTDDELDDVAGGCTWTNKLLFTLPNPHRRRT